MQGHSRSDELLEDFCDAEVYAQHSLYSKFPHALQMMFYYDDVEVCNPIGSRTKIHKLGKLFDYSVFQIYMYHVVFIIALFYYTLGNIISKTSCCAECHSTCCCSKALISQ